MLIGCGGAAAPSTGAPATATSTPATAATQAAAPVSGPDVIREAISSTGVDRIPAFTTTGEDTHIFELIYGSLFQIQPGGSSLQPSLATSYTTSADAKTWTFQLRKGVKWSGGYGDFTCNDVAFTWNFNKDPANKSFWKAQASAVQSVDCPDPYTAVFHLAAPNADFGWAVADVEPSTGWIISKAAWDKLGKAGYEQTPIGTGPYMIKQVIPNQEVDLVANPDYWGPKPAVPSVQFKVITDAQTAALAVASGALDIASVDAVTAAQYKSNAKVKTVVKPALQTQWIEINTKLKPFDDVRVRDAIRYAIDYPTLVKNVFLGLAQVGPEAIIMPGEIGYDASVNPNNVYDPAKAKQLLQQAGVSSVKGDIATYNSQVDVNAGQLITADLQQAGIDLQVRNYDRGTLDAVWAKNDTAAAILGAAASPDPSFILSVCFLSSQNPPGGLNIARYSGIDQLFQQQQTAPTEAARVQYVKQIQQQIAQDAPGWNLWIQDDIWLVNPRVQNFLPTVYFSGDPLNLVTLGG